MNISDLKIGKYVVVNDLGASKYSSGMRVIGKVVSVDPYGNSAIISSLPDHNYEITDFNDFELWSKQIEDKTESMGLKNQSNDVQQCKRKDNVNSPSHYNYGEIEVIDYCDQVCKQYPPELAPYVFNAIKYLSRATHKNGSEDIAKAKYFVQRLFDKWE